MRRNDLAEGGGNIIQEIIVFSSIILFLLLSGITHELAHRRAALKRGYQAWITIERNNRFFPDFVTHWTGKPFNKEDNKAIIRAGIVAGIVPLMIYALFIPYMGFIPVLAACIAYYFLCRSDLQQLRSLQ